jgi:hypothetical protein
VALALWQEKTPDEPKVIAVWLRPIEEVKGDRGTHCSAIEITVQHGFGCVKDENKKDSQRVCVEQPPCLIFQKTGSATGWR